MCSYITTGTHICVHMPSTEGIVELLSMQEIAYVIMACCITHHAPCRVCMCAHSLALVTGQLTD